jgi:succinoglycan biosynthesis transport protein ExoP
LVVDEPFSRFAETIRSLNVAADVADPSVRNKVIGVTSVLLREGKSVVAANLSEMIAISGGKALLIDGDLRNRALTRQLAPAAEAGLIDVLAHRAAVEELVWRDPNTNLDFLPVGSPIGAANFPIVLASPVAMQGLLKAVRGRYDYVILDLPPMAPVADVKAASHLIDFFVLVIEWGRTSREAVVDALNTAPLVGQKLLGAVLNKADMTTSKKLDL